MSVNEEGGDRGVHPRGGALSSLRTGDVPVVPMLMSLCRSVNARRVWGAETAANGNGEAQSASIRTAASPTTVAATIETDAEGAVYPVIYVRRSGRIEERTLPGHPLHDFGPDGHRRALAALLGAVAVVAAEESSLQSGR
jgi:hypothetical protein